MEAGTQTDSIFLGFSKSFDRVPYSHLISKLSSLNIDSLVLSWIRKFLSFRPQFSVSGDYQSDVTEVTSGLRWAPSSVHSSFLFASMTYVITNRLTYASLRAIVFYTDKL